LADNDIEDSQNVATQDAERNAPRVGEGGESAVEMDGVAIILLEFQGRLYGDERCGSTDSGQFQIGRRWRCCIGRQSGQQSRA